jgi:hypothetical protein
MTDPVTRLEAWCDRHDVKVFASDEQTRLVAAYRAIIDEYKVLRYENGPNEALHYDSGLENGLLSAIERLADAHNPVGNQ